VAPDSAALGDTAMLVRGINRGNRHLGDIAELAVIDLNKVAPDRLHLGDTNQLVRGLRSRQQHAG
jgi:hypothetical protein